jgi:hypothetical protein
MTWTHEKPTVPGWYWYKSAVWKTFSIETVFQSPNRSCYINSCGHIVPVDDVDGEWAGPIPEPEGGVTNGSMGS